MFSIAIRNSIARRIPATATPMLGRGLSNVYSEGSVAQSQGFRKKEKAHEDEYTRRHERQQLEKLRKEIQAKQEELAKLEEKHGEKPKSE
ncbi:hypothetical protein BDM02DRAFT_3186540 [Thelephora ganbajun]|uniref:Uncharacterized protein n=1 Tax=Thelephora ganbajun TaxID=370292 RepID=A0ACB6ZHQ0_THEGA|nr:hypothetical protein BDM02DRAFT_3186540 [Thelephora ganbajun]